MGDEIGEFLMVGTLPENCRKMGFYTAPTYNLALMAMAALGGERLHD